MKAIHNCKVRNFIPVAILGGSLGFAPSAFAGIHSFIVDARWPGLGGIYGASQADMPAVRFRNRAL